MFYSNHNSIKILKLWLTITGLICLCIMGILIFIQQFLYLLIFTGAFILSMLLIAIIDFQYIRISEEKKKLIIQYFSIFSVFRSYHSIEFPIEFLRKVSVLKSFFGLKWSLRLTVRIREGIADYPPVSLSGVPVKDRKQLIAQLKQKITRIETN